MKLAIFAILTGFFQLLSIVYFLDPVVIPEYFSCLFLFSETMLFSFNVFWAYCVKMLRLYQSYSRKTKFFFIKLQYKSIALIHAIIMDKRPLYRIILDELENLRKELSEKLTIWKRKSILRSITVTSTQVASFIVIFALIPYGVCYFFEYYYFS